MDFKKLLPIIGIILFVYIIIDTGIYKIANAFSLIPIQYYILGFVPFSLFLVFTVVKWQYLSKKQKMKFTNLQLVKISLISRFYGNVTPGGFGGYIRILYLKKFSKASIEKCIVNMLIDVTTGSIIGFSIALIGSIILIEAVPGFFPVILLFLILNVTTFVVFIKKSRGNKIYNFFIRRLIPKKYKDRTDKSFESLYEDIPRLRDMIIPMIIEIIVWTVIGAQVYIFALAFSLNIPIHMFILIHTISVVSIVILPISIGGLGVREGAFVFILHNFYGIEKEIALVISLSGYIVKMLIPTVLGMIIAIKERKIL
jgi:hypothetical protein